MFDAADDWPAGAVEVDVRAGDAWRPALDWRHLPEEPGRDDPSLTRPTGDTEWRARCWPADGGAIVERSGTAAVIAGQTTTVRLTKLR